jgi:hypothetical protein
MKPSKFIHTDWQGNPHELERFDYEDYKVDKNLCDQLNFLKVFDNGGKRYEHPLLNIMDTACLDWNAHQQVCKDPNMLIIWHWMKHVETYEPEWKYKNAFINWARLNTILFQENPYWRSRLGHLMWWAVNYANPDSYYILKWEYHNDPRAWYKPGEPRRRQDMPPAPKGSESSTGS